MEFPGAWNAQYIDDQYARWRADPEGVTAEWRAFFEGFELGSSRLAVGAAEAAPDALAFQAKAEALIYRYRDLGHLMACLDPLTVCPTSHPLLDLEAFGLRQEDLERPVHAPGFGQGEQAPLGEVLEVLRETYCRSMGVEYMHLQDPAEREWLRSRMEPARNRADLSAEEHREVLRWLVRAGRFEEFLQKRYLGQTRFSLEGGEVLIPQLRDLVRAAAASGVREVVLGMAHRGRLNVHVHLLDKSYHELCCQFEATYDPEAVPGGGDVKYHSGYAGEVATEAGAVRVILPENPSHLEAVNPVVEGIARALQDRQGEGGPGAVLPILIHGDSAFPGQGIVAETLNLSRLPGYATGGTVHIVLNNQIGYTTPPEHARSTRYATDVAKMLMVPIFHVHGESPGAVLFATRLALAYRQEFGKDAVVDLVCYRRHGHNEGDEPYFTQPLLYEQIRERPPVYELYAQELAEAGIGGGELQRLAAEADEDLEEGYQAAKAEACAWEPPQPWDGWEEVENRYTGEEVETGVPEDELRALGQALARVPEGFSLHSKLQKILGRRSQALDEEGAALDWAWAEALAFASLLREGVPVRLSGEDSGRGTFSQRHAVWFDTETGETHVPLNHLAEDQARFQVFDSPLSEAAVLGFEYGYSAVDPETLVLWEAQYGDFADGAQVITDQFVASAEAKWQRASGLVLLLPHGYEGQGPDHSTARPERFLQLCAEENLQVCQPTTPAQYFHLLRRQVKAPWRKPLVVLTPKSLLRHPEAVSSLSGLVAGTFAPVLDDPEGPKPSAVKRVLLCTGKVYYALKKRRAEAPSKAGNVALVRLEQLYPFPEAALREVKESYTKAREWVWVQDEPANMGAWTFAEPRLRAVLGADVAYAGRKEAASPATGFPFLHRAEEEALLAEAIPGAEKGKAAEGRSKKPAPNAKERKPRGKAPRPVPRGRASQKKRPQ